MYFEKRKREERKEGREERRKFPLLFYFALNTCVTEESSLEQISETLRQSEKICALPPVMLLAMDKLFSGTKLLLETKFLLFCNFLFNFSWFIKFIGMTLVDTIIEVPSVQLYHTLCVYHAKSKLLPPPHI